jgi:hypothetical protein
MNGKEQEKGNRKKGLTNSFAIFFYNTGLGL